MKCKAHKNGACIVPDIEGGRDQQGACIYADGDRCSLDYPPGWTRSKGFSRAHISGETPGPGTRPE